MDQDAGNALFHHILDSFLSYANKLAFLKYNCEFNASCEQADIPSMMELKCYESVRH